MNPHPDIKTVASEAEMLALGRDFAAKIFAAPGRNTIFELIGDVGAGKTTFTRGLAEGLKIAEPVTSPSFTISKRYAFPLPDNFVTSENSSSLEKCCKNYNTSDNAPSTPASPAGQLIHYDFYRLDDPGIMRDELAEALSEPNSVIVVEWGGDVADLLPADKIRLEITLRADGSRLVKITNGLEITEPPSRKNAASAPSRPTQATPNLNPIRPAQAASNPDPSRPAAAQTKEPK